MGWDRWNSWAPAELNYFMWRAFDERCGIGTKTCDHLLSSCIIAQSILWCILVWLKIPIPSNQFSTKGLWDLLGKCKGSK
ncbi:hypothetical protein HanRHA438_Chr04g0177261 [Helianthus annuus]|uniref:Reverse transcriptase zinc-binding domain-containing protein n=1 Tax=Helianthus annuus TaxID=4232 RepID=A0A251T198_HELAN|nr:hypothetical protein HanXRQr2_Chr04g0167591 [Helianthus annuus]KAJ0581142.1 hypothetical protein HanHA300_Chr04g0137571 [Helianthus annuus]KAJ0588974.1 hypothetical protein HanIR_Chr04g0180861 [Helianthus annuus]KAJ0597086.1 hypothetical protein HanHA89_Chr04g0150501 [Helianthus annuus]KAJ0757768.1 hypothetical protein HanLR1_Chr04g0142611 [Helianthus annuus]